MRKAIHHLNKIFKHTPDSYDIKAYKVMIKHLNNKNSQIYYNPLSGEILIVNDLTHYYLILTESKAILINTYDVITLNTSSYILERINKKARNKLITDRNNLKKVILEKKELSLDRILTKI